MKHPTLSKIQLSTLTVCYLFFLNAISNKSYEQVFLGLWVALLLLFLCFIFGLLHRYVLKVFLAIQLFIGSACVFAKYNYNTVITKDIILSAFTSETDLMLEMVSPKLIIWLIITGLLPIVFISFIKIKDTKYSHQLIKTVLYSAVIFAFVSINFWVQGYHFRSKGHIRDERFARDLNYFSPIDFQYSLRGAIRAHKKSKHHYANAEILSQKYHYSTQNDDLLVVFVIGESTRGDHMSINGYARDTTPKLSTIPNLYSFKNATSCDTLTIHSVHCMMSPMLKSQEDRQIHHSSVGEVLKSLGYHTEIYALQTMSEFYNYLKYDKLMTKYTILNEQKDGAKDKSLLPYAHSAIDGYQGGKKFIVLHTLGSHQTYADRFDDNDATFLPYCTNPDVAKCQPQELINAYDNSVLGVDNFLSSVIKKLQNKKAILFYVSDHGESLGENGNYFHGIATNIAPKEQLDIGFIVWFSDSYRQTDGQAFAKNIQAHIDQATPISHDHVFHSLLGCAGVQSVDGGIDQKLNFCADFPSNSQQTQQTSKPLY